MIAIILLVFAFVLACLASRNYGAPNWSLGWLSLACYFLSLLAGSFAHFPR
jgi:amino acid transporter